jgi:hypothetical protein
MDMDPKAIPNTTTSEISLPDKSMDLIQSNATANKITTEKANGTSVEGATSLSPEIFIPDDNIINTQESVGAEMEVDNRSLKNLMEDGDKGDVPSSQVQKLEAGGEGTSLQEDERRRSDRLKKDTNLHTMDKVKKLAKKRNLKGNSTNENYFSILPIEESVSISPDMDIDIKNDDFVTFDLLKTLESARNDLYLKENEIKQNSQTESVENPQKNDDQLHLEWLQEETSMTEYFILVESRKKRRGNKKNIKISPMNKNKLQDQENSSLPKKEGEASQGQNSQKSQRKEKMIMNGLIWNCEGLKKKGVAFS